MFKDLVLKNRSYRRFRQEPRVTAGLLRELVELARFSPSAANLQPLRYILSADPDTNARVFEHLAWAGYLTKWPGPAEGERPTGYIIILRDNEVSPSVDCDHGIAAQTMLLGAADRGFGGCMIGSIKREALAQTLQVAARYAILLVIALGTPGETVVLEESADDVKYWRDDRDVHHVPKRPLGEIILAQH